MDFFEHQEVARRKTGLLVIYFAIAVVLIICAVYLAVAGILFYGQTRGDYGPTTLWFPDVFVAVSLGTLLVIFGGSLYKTSQLSGGGEVVARALGGRLVAANTQDLRERVLLNVVEEMAIASGTPVPPVYLLDQESAINAFAAGTTPQNAVIGITRGSIETLKRDQLQGVIAHEFSHILNGDMRLNIRLMGILNGILVIAMIGYFLMRSSSSSVRFSNSSSDKKGGNPLPLLGFCLYVIGYIGIFFGHLIKSAVSRQREFLADASAVQFTRMPDGIAGALKAIGGLVYGSQLKTPQAEEASHMFFGNGLSAWTMQLLATHPPLDERIRRIDPKFDGRFPTVTRVDYAPKDVIDPTTLASRRAASQDVHAAAVAGVQSFAAEPVAAVAQVGAPRSEHLEYAAELIASLPPELAKQIRDPLGALATIYALLLNDNDPEVQKNQLWYLSTKADAGAYQETLRIAPLVANLNAEIKLPLVSMILPVLKSGLSPSQFGRFRDEVTYLIKADNAVSLFEYAVHRLISKRLVTQLKGKTNSSAKPVDLNQLAPACQSLLTALAYCGTRDQREATRAFNVAIQRLPRGLAGLEILPQAQAGLRTIDAALDQLARVNPPGKKQLLEACAECIGADARVSVEEGELLRVISDALDCPMPPLISSPAKS